MANKAKPCPCNDGDRMEYGGLGQEVQTEHINSHGVKHMTGPNLMHGLRTKSQLTLKSNICSEYIFVCIRVTEWIFCPFREMDATIKYLKNKCGVKHIGIVGFCWGDIATHYAAQYFPEIKAAVSVYGNDTMDDKFDLKSPTLFIFGDKDEFIPLEQVDNRMYFLKNHHLDYQVKIFPGQTHGFLHRKREDINPEDEPHIQEGRRDMLIWLNKYM
uniref:Carboxymethylenebutenolidase homolog n=1 Tax=Periophthalmus magnuspinnatus TaxID=409849 RepID=A0A3B4B4H1_9GOBI